LPVPEFEAEENTTAEQIVGTRFEPEGFGGELVRPDDESDDAARQVFNGQIDRRPVLIARCRTADETSWPSCPTKLSTCSSNMGPGLSIDLVVLMDLVAVWLARSAPALTLRFVCGHLDAPDRGLRT
jgi:hypothetical protein